MEEAKEASDKEAARARVVEVIEKAKRKIGDVEVTAPEPKERRDDYVEKLEVVRTALDDSASEKKREKAMEELGRINLKADQFAIERSCNDLSILDEL